MPSPSLAGISSEINFASSPLADADGSLFQTFIAFIQVVPEVELPGHCCAALAAYPQLSCTGQVRAAACLPLPPPAASGLRCLQLPLLAAPAASYCCCYDYHRPHIRFLYHTLTPPTHHPHTTPLHPTPPQAMEVPVTWGIKDDVYCAGKEEVFAFLGTVMEEVAALFPCEYIHIGGDEVRT